jgi:hypothetical protein
MKRLWMTLYVIVLVLGYHLCIFGYYVRGTFSPNEYSIFIFNLYFFAFLYIIDLFIDIRRKITRFLTRHVKRFFY